MKNCLFLEMKCDNLKNENLWPVRANSDSGTDVQCCCVYTFYYITTSDLAGRDMQMEKIQRKNLLL